MNGNIYIYTTRERDSRSFSHQSVYLWNYVIVRLLLLHGLSCLVGMGHDVRTSHKLSQALVVQGVDNVAEDEKEIESSQYGVCEIHVLGKGLGRVVATANRVGSCNDCASSLLGATPRALDSEKKKTKKKTLRVAADTPSNRPEEKSQCQPLRWKCSAAPLPRESTRGLGRSFCQTRQ